IALPTTAPVTTPAATPPQNGPGPQPPRHAFAGLNVAIAVAPTIAAATRPFRIICLMSSPRDYCLNNPTVPFTPDEYRPAGVSSRGGQAEVRDGISCCL